MQFNYKEEDVIRTADFLLSLTKGETKEAIEIANRYIIAESGWHTTRSDGGVSINYSVTQDQLCIFWGEVKINLINRL
jgi:hypothetical protein